MAFKVTMEEGQKYPEAFENPPPALDPQSGSIPDVGLGKKSTLDPLSMKLVILL
jgi:hypothetical protein